jgi:hypothetical protein
MECVSLDIECGRPLLALIDAHYKCNSFGIVVDIHFVEWNATFSQEISSCGRVFALDPGVHSDMFWFQRSTSLRSTAPAGTA